MGSNESSILVVVVLLLWCDGRVDCCCCWYRITVVVIVVVFGDRDDGMLRMEGGKAGEVQKSNIPVTPKMKFFHHLKKALSAISLPISIGMTLKIV